MRRKSLLFASLILILIRNSFAQDILFDLKGTDKIILEVAGFELSEVLNTQADLTLIGKVYNTNNQLIKAKINKGLSNGIKTFYSNSIKKTDPGRVIQLKVLEFKIAEKPQSSKVASGELKIKFGYYLKTSFEPVHLVDYEAGITYKRSIHRMDLIDQILNRGLANSIVFFNDWINGNASVNRKLAKTVRLDILEKKKKSDQDTVFYDHDRLLTWDDFRERPNKLSGYNATIFTSLAMEGSPFMENGVLVFPIEVKVYMLPESSWVKTQGKSDYALNHEQRHFDVTRVVGNRLIERLKALQVTLENYEALVNDVFFDSYREMNKLQEIYDARTKHGLDKDAQSRWNSIIDQALNGNMDEVERELMKGI
ncbi:hypothetical protein MMU07_14310 [Aquiflexum sp. LQ15W]|uniref:DUF922 domain-containing protein n=1 Tax=Cognataquiflexum nitidum TaxID=2922272 RepID=UPI001F14751E|nr:hypothetical protein [Cognataquiflexum nitidum]MCH6200755.1 hypothetical protein [Cognataquiflexum nitidum]